MACYELFKIFRLVLLYTLFSFILANGFVLDRDAVGLSKRFDSRIEVLLTYGIADIIILCIDLIEQIPALIAALLVFENFLHQNINSHDCANPER